MVVFKKHGKWYIDFYYQGKRCRQKIGTKKKDAEEALNQIKVKIAAGDFVPPDMRKQEDAFQRQPLLFETFAEKSFYPWSEAAHSASHHRLQQSIVRGQLIPHFGGQHLHEITPKILEDYVIKRSRSLCLRGKKKHPVKGATVNRDIACLKVLFRKAVEWGLLDESPATGLKKFKEIPNPPRLLELEEITALLDAIPGHQKALIACVVYAGLR